MSAPSKHIAALLFATGSVGWLAGCSGAQFGEAVALSRETHASLVDDFAAGKPLALPQDLAFNLYDSQRSATAGGRAESTADPAGRAQCQASAEEVGTATAEFQLGHVLDNRGQGPLEVTARFVVDYACRVRCDPQDRSKPADELGLRIFVRDSNKRLLDKHMLTEASEAGGTRDWTGRETHAFDLTLEPGLAYYFVVAGRVSVTGTESSGASARIEVNSFNLELSSRN